MQGFFACAAMRKFACILALRGVKFNLVPILLHFMKTAPFLGLIRFEVREAGRLGYETAFREEDRPI
jgi:hypothetical protein